MFTSVCTNLTGCVSQDLLHTVIRLCDQNFGFGEGCLSPEEGLEIVGECDRQCGGVDRDPVDVFSMFLGFFLAVGLHWLVRYWKLGKYS